MGPSRESSRLAILARLQELGPGVVTESHSVLRDWLQDWFLKQLPKLVLKEGKDGWEDKEAVGAMLLELESLFGRWLPMKFMFILVRLREGIRPLHERALDSEVHDMPFADGDLLLPRKRSITQNSRVLRLLCLSTMPEEQWRKLQPYVDVLTDPFT